MRHESVAKMFQQYHADKANGNKRSPLHTLQECCEAAGIDHRVFGRYAAKYPGAPQPVLRHDKTAWRSGSKYYRKHEFVQWVKQVLKQKEKAMPDIKTALEKALSKTAQQWAADDEAHHQIEPQQESEMTPKRAYFSVTNNVCRSTFDFVRDNPGMTRVEIAKELDKKGFNPKSVSSLLGQMLRQELMRENGKLIYTTSNEYSPIKSSKVMKARAENPNIRKKVTIVNTRTGEVFNPAPAGIAALPAAPIEKEWSPNDVIDKLSVRQALELFKELRNILVG